MTILINLTVTDDGCGLPLEKNPMVWDLRSWTTAHDRSGRSLACAAVKRAEL